MNAPKLLDDAQVILHLEVEVAPENRARFLDFCRRAFPIYESTGGNRMALYEDISRPGFFNEVGYYRTLEDYRRGESAVKSDPIQAALIAEWRALLNTAPKVSVYRKTII